MIAAWMVEATIVALLFAAGAAVAQRVSSLFRGAPVRWFWAAALAGTFATSAVWFAPSRRSATPTGATVATPALPPVAAASATSYRLPALPAGVERGLMVAWAAASTALGLLLLFALVRLSRERRNWADGVVGGAQVGVSNALGPAAVGIVRPRVVIPRWVLALDDAAQRAIVAHEQEHQRTRDPALLVAGLVAVVLMPWNAGVWLAWRGLRLAIEFDCDERVLARGVDRAGYAQVLLGAWGLTRGSWLPTAALTRASGLGSRVQHLMRPEPRRRGMKTALGIAAAAVLVIAACETPAPQRIAGPPGPDASRNVAAAVMTTDPLVIIDGVRQRGDTLVIRALQGDVTVYGNAAQDAGDRISVGRNVPRIAVDSVRVSNDGVRPERTASENGGEPSVAAGGGNRAVSRILAKISPDSIASIEVLKGNAATAEYGPDAAHGVIIITTKAPAKKN